VIRRAREGAAWLILVAACLVAYACLAQDRDDESPAVPERSIKAAYLYKFAGYVEWPPGRFPNAAAPVTIGVAGDPALADELARISVGRTVDARPIEVRRIEPDDSLDGIEVLFMTGPTADGLRPQLETAANGNRPILTVGDEADTEGSVIRFVVDRDRVRFDISLDAAERNGIKLNSRLLAVARRVDRRRSGDR
jgi:hypothetical protein